MRVLRRKRIASLAALCAAVLVVGCGGDDGDGGSNNADDYSGTEADVASVVDDLANAGRDGDGAKICEEILTTELVETVEQESDQSCASEFASELEEGEYELEIDSLEVDGDTATVGVTDQKDRRSVLHIERVDDDWRIASVPPAE
jgi:hypothetical protein